MNTSTRHVHPIPVVTNLLLLTVCSALYFLLLRMASRGDSTLAVVACGFAFAVNMIPIYALIHEAEHNLLHPDPAWNDRLGRWLCCLFVVSFTFFKHCHLRHHRKNRTDIEMWELYYAHQSRWRRRGNLLLMMSGLGYLSLWLSVLLFAVAPSLVYCGILQRHTEVAGFLQGSEQPAKIAAMRRESWVAIVFQAAMIILLDLDLRSWLTLFLLHGFVWSSQNYVNHAFSRRDIVNGAHNLWIPAWLHYVYLNFNLHLAHHQNPGIPWVHLPEFVPPGPRRTSFFRNYLRLWTGPALTHEPEPVLHAQARERAGT
jgi:fatty acid desaturase